jgi:phosphatidylglycerophosphatase A
MENVQQNNTLKPRWYDIITTWFYIGKSPFMPGTIGSIGAYPLYYFSVMSSITTIEAKNTMLIIILFLCIIGYLAIKAFHKDTGMVDHKSIVIDEVIGQLLVFAIAYEWIGESLNRFFNVSHENNSMVVTYIFICGFIPFRYFDIRKPFFIWSIDRYCKNAVGVILDDVLAGIYTALVFYILYKTGLK